MKGAFRSVFQGIDIFLRRCFIHWYRTGFLEGKLERFEGSGCGDAWEKYRACVLSELRLRGHERIAELEFDSSH